MEKKRHREKQRRLEISISVDRLTKTIVKAVPDILNTISSSRSDSDKEFFGVDEASPAAAAAAARPQSASNVSWSSLNRNDVINIACDVIERLNNEVTLLRAEKMAKNAKPSTLQNEDSTTPSDDKELQQKSIISSSASRASAACTSRTTLTRNQEDSDISDRNSFNASQYVPSGTSNNVAYDHAIALLVLQQQQQSQQHGPVSSFATGGDGAGWATRPTTDGSGSTSSLGARFLQHKSADVSHLQQIRRNDMSQQQSTQHEEQLLLQQLRYQQSIQEILRREEISARMHPRVSYNPNSLQTQGRMVPALSMAQPGNAAFAAAAGFENAGGLTAVSLAVPPVTSFGGISSDDVVPPSVYPLYARKNLQQQGQHGQEVHSFR